MNFPQENERLQLSRRKFFFFGAILAAKPEIVVPKTWRIKTPLMPLPKTGIVVPKTAVWPGGGLASVDNFKHAIFFLPGDRLSIYYGQSDALDGITITVTRRPA